MKTRTTLKLIAIALISTRASTAFAHEGHGLFGSHWHATDVLGFVAGGIAVTVAVWLTRGKK